MIEQQNTLVHDQGGSLLRAGQLTMGTPPTAQDNRHSLHMLGVVAAQYGLNDIAITLMNFAIKANPTEAFYYVDLGSVMERLNRFEDAASAYRQALLVDPNHAAAHSNLGCVLKAMGKPDEVDCQEKALLREPGPTVLEAATTK